MDEDPGPSACKRPLLEGNSGGENSVEDPGSTDPPQDAWLSSWNSLGRPASANRATLWDLMDIFAKPKFREKFKLGFKAVVGFDWNDSDFCGNELQKKLDSNSKSKFNKTFNKDQRPLVLSGNILEWDITLLRAAIQALIDASNSNWNPANMAQIVALKDLRNTLGHTGGHHFQENEFETMYETFKNNVIALGWTAEEVDAARKRLTMPLNVYVCEAPKKLFCGRQDKVRECKEAIRLCKLKLNAKDRIVAIKGFGGMGKTQLARSLGQILRSGEAADPELSFDVIFCFDAQTEGSLEKGFKDLAERLGILDKLPKSGKLTVDDISRIYVHLGIYYNQRVLFIFDNAEQLKAQNGKFGLKTYLGPRNDCCGPVFLVTSRDPWHLWIHPSKCIKVDELSSEDSLSCLLGYMGVPEEERQSEDLKKPLASLVKLIGGHPLGLKLCGSAIETNVRRSKENRYSWTHGVKEYLYLLSHKRLHELSGEAKYKERVRTICQDTLAKIRKESQGSTAIALLGIITYLSPDCLELMLVKFINLYKRPDDNYLLLGSWDDLPLDMRTEMNILRDYSLIDLEDTVYYKWKNVLVKIHRLVQECTRELIQSDPELTPERDPLQKIITFSDRYHLPRKDIVFILNLYATNPSELSPLHEESKWKLRSRIAASEHHLEALNPALEDLATNDEEEYLVKLLLLRWKWDPLGSEFYSELYGVIRKLYFDYGYHSRDWFIELCSNVLHWTIRRWYYYIPPHKNDMKKKILEMSEWVLTGYLRCEIIHDISAHLLGVVNVVITNGGSTESSLLPKIFAKSTVGDFWRNASDAFPSQYVEISEEWLACLVSCPKTNLFTISLQSLEESGLYDDLIYKSGFVFWRRLNDAAREPQLRCQLSKDRDRFVPSFWKMTELIFGRVTPENKQRTAEILGDSITFILSTWCELFSGDESLYQYYQHLLDNKVAVWLELSPGLPDECSLMNHSSLENFASCKHCSAETKHWIDEVCRLVKMDLSESELESEESSDLESESEEPDAPVTIMENDN